MPDLRTPYRTLLNKSGVPFQLAAEQAIRSVGAHHKVDVVAREVAWSKGFLDVLARRESVLFAFECKRVEDGIWIFVLSEEAQERQTRCRLEWFNPRAPMPVLRTKDHSRTFCSEWNVVEGSPESDFCVVPKGKAVNSLEEVCRNLLAGSHEILDSDEIDHGSDPVVMVPVILTNARIITCKLKPSEIKLTTGTLADDQGEFEEVPIVRFRKTLSASRSNWYDSSPLVADEWVADRERSVFVVTASALGTFFHGFRSFSCVDPDGVPREFREPPRLEEDIFPLSRLEGPGRPPRA